VTVMLDCAISWTRHGKFTESGFHAVTSDVRRRRASSEAVSSRELVSGSSSLAFSRSSRVAPVIGFRAFRQEFGDCHVSCEQCCRYTGVWSLSSG
jgi:hypothetical protein